MNDLETAVIYVTGPLHASSAAAICEQIEITAAAPKVRLYVSSTGGSRHAHDAIVTALQKSGRPIEAVGLTEVCSAAALLFLAAGIRFARRDTVFMLHRSWQKLEAATMYTATELRSFADALDYIAKADAKDLAAQLRLSDGEIARFMAGEDLYFTGDAALAAGIVHGFVDEPSRGI